MHRYPKMKDSGIEWIGEIPNYWSTTKLKHACIVNPPKSEISNLPNDHRISFLPMEKIGEDGSLTLDENRNLSEVKNSFTYFKNGDIIVAKITPCFENGKGSLCSNLENGIGFGTTELHVLRTRNQYENSFIYYWTRSYQFSQTGESLMYGSAGQKRVPTEFVKDFIISCPQSKTEQKQIVDFLDIQTSKIDSQIKTNRKLISLLQEKRQATINQAVTEGLDPTVPMKDSGVEWIGEIPDEWLIQKIKHTSYVKGRIGWQGLKSDEFTDQGPFLVTGTDFQDGKINWRTCHHVEQWRFDQDPHIQLKNKDILITKDGTIGKVAYIDEVPGQTTLNSGVMVIRPLKNEYLPRYLYWLLKSKQFLEFINLIKSGTTIQHLYQETFGNFQFTLPKTIADQKQIVDFLESKTRLMDLTIEKLKQQIEKLQEFRQSLISAAATGKIDVRSAAIA